ncbi:MAG: fibronectin type III domain-containing protein, partial [Ruminiclostridium sp.]|nr:fibronectin type III domain-containing protein [Ruminiclostridium sp.]
INFSKTDTTTPADVIEFETSGAASVKVWWVKNKADRQIAVFKPDGTAVFTANEEGGDNALCITSIDLADGGKYYLGNTDKGGNYIFKVAVTTGAAAEVPLTPWDEIAEPVIGEITQNGGKIVVPITADVTKSGGDQVVIEMLDESGKVVGTMTSLAEKTEHSREFTPTASGTYTFKAILSREDEDDKISEPVDFDFILPLGKPTIASATSMGGGKIALVWSEVPEAESYIVFCDGTEAGTTDKTAYTVDGLTVGKEYSFTVQAVRGTDKGSKSAEKTATATAEEQRVWGHVYYGPSTGAASTNSSGVTSGDGSVGDLNKDGKVTVFSEGGKGKIVPGGSDGLSFYYTAIPDSLNFTLRAKAHVDSWTYSNGQDGFGLIAMDSLPTVGKANHWTNQYMLAVTKIEYRWDSENNKVTRDDGVGDKYSMQLGVGASNNKTGITPENLAAVEANVTDVVNAVAPNKSHQDPLEFSSVGKPAGTY